jgi:hypothetical protein
MENAEVGMLRQNRGLSTPEVFEGICDYVFVVQKQANEVLHSTPLHLVSLHYSEF